MPGSGGRLPVLSLIPSLSALIASWPLVNEYRLHTPRICSDIHADWIAGELFAMLSVPSARMKFGKVLTDAPAASMSRKKNAIALPSIEAAP